MEQEIISLAECGDGEFAVNRSVELLRQGKLAVFPTETVYGLAALASNEEAVKRLCVEKGRRAGHALPVAISGIDALNDFIPNLCPLAKRLATRFWPGPLTLVLNADDPQSAVWTLPEFSRRAVMPESTVGFRTPRNDFLLRVLRKLNEPIVLTSANLSGEAPATSASEARDALGARPDLVIDDGPASFGKPSTVVRIDGKDVTVLREGAVSKDRLVKGMAKVVVFVCTGNTCRSPLAEVLCKKALAERLGTPVSELEAHGYVILSAGISAPNFAPASVQSRQVAQDYGLSLTDHSARTFDETLAKIADRIYTLGASHRNVLLNYYPELRDRISLLRVDGGDVDDPFGASVEVYRACAKQIEEQIRARLPEILE